MFFMVRHSNKSQKESVCVKFTFFLTKVYEKKIKLKNKQLFLKL